MGQNSSSGQGEEGLGPDLEGLLAKVPPPKAPAWLAAKTLARLRQEEVRGKEGRFWLVGWRWAWAAGTAVLVAGWMLWERPRPGFEISDGEVFAALDALVQQEEENRWWAGL